MTDDTGLSRRVGVLEAFGLVPLADTVAAVRRITGQRGQEAPPRLGPSSVRIFKPGMGLPAWLGLRRADRRVPVYNLFNRVPAPRGTGYSVRVTFARDFRGGRHTYDGHLGTDFVCPIGTPVTAAAPGVVLRVGCELDRGGLKVCIDHGDGLFVTCNHLSRALVRPGERVRRGQVVALSGASGLEFLPFFPWVAPHLHYNTWLDGTPTDPFARAGEVSLWRRPNDPEPTGPPARYDAGDVGFRPSAWSERGVREAIDCCRDPDVRAACLARPTLAERAAEVLLQRNYRTSIFDGFPDVYAERHARAPRLDLPFRDADYVGLWLPPVSA
jgi:murein DD-endopeptidase MepM/ murein hydrolase activator NlpD